MIFQTFTNRNLKLSACSYVQSSFILTRLNKIHLSYSVSTKLTFFNNSLSLSIQLYCEGVKDLL